MGLLLIIVLLRIRLTWGSRNYKSVFTAHDVYRATYCPTTIPEEQFTDWDPENTPQCPPNLIPSVQAGSALVQEYKSNDSGHPTGSTEGKALWVKFLVLLFHTYFWKIKLRRAFV